MFEGNAKPGTLAADLRALRKARGMTLAAMADKLGRSVGWLSQVERNLSEPSVTDLRQVSSVLGIPVSLLFGNAAAPPEEAGFVVRRGARRTIGTGEGGLIEELLSPDLTDDFEMVHSTFQPHSQITEPVARPTQEVGYVISGNLDLQIGERLFTVSSGDSFRIRGEPFRWMNPYDEPTAVIWVIAPPVY